MPTHYKGTDKELEVLNTFIKLMRATESINSRLSKHLSANNLTVSQFGVLEALLHIGPQNQRELGAKLLKTGGNITMVIENLVKRALVKREPDPNDGRAHIIHLTKKGKSYISEFFPSHLEKIVEEFDVLTPEELEQLAYLSKKVGLK
jgi:MarR family 2-MHQ and catechol resistance regulon transcriptional repressor